MKVEGLRVTLAIVSVEKLTTLRIRKFAASRRPPQEWYDEDMDGLWRSAESLNGETHAVQSDAGNS